MSCPAAGGCFLFFLSLCFILLSMPCLLVRGQCLLNVCRPGCDPTWPVWDNIIEDTLSSCPKKKGSWTGCKAGEQMSIFGHFHFGVDGTRSDIFNLFGVWRETSNRKGLQESVNGHLCPPRLHFSFANVVKPPKGDIFFSSDFVIYNFSSSNTSSIFCYH